MLSLFNSFAFTLGRLALGTCGLLHFLCRLIVGIGLGWLPCGCFIDTGCLGRLSLACLFCGSLLLLTSGLAAGLMGIGLLPCGFSGIFSGRLLLLLIGILTGVLSIRGLLLIGFAAALARCLLLLLLTAVLLWGCILGISSLSPVCFAAALASSLLLLLLADVLLASFLAGLLSIGGLLLVGFGAAFAGSLLLLLFAAFTARFLAVGSGFFFGLT